MEMCLRLMDHRKLIMTVDKEVLISVYMTTSDKDRTYQLKIHKRSTNYLYIHSMLKTPVADR